MACGCKKRAPVATPQAQQTIYPAEPQAHVLLPMLNEGGSMECNDSNLVPIRYNGPVGRHMVRSPLKKFGSYGLHTRGDIFCVHFDDQKVAPKIFVLIDPPKPEPAPAPPPAPAPEPKPEPAVATQLEPETPDKADDLAPRAKSKKDKGGIL